MNAQGAVDSPPEIGVANRHHPPKRFPLPVVLAPMLEPESQSALHVVTGREQSDARRAVNRLQSADHRQKLQTLAGHVRLAVGDFDTRLPVERLKHEFPAAPSAIPNGATALPNDAGPFLLDGRVQEIVRCRHTHFGESSQREG
jgi:hypothetical protein